MTPPLARFHFLRFAAARLALALLAGFAIAGSSVAQETVPLEERGYALGDIILGDENAPVTVIEYVSFTCSHCATFHTESYPDLKSQYIDTGKVNYIIREVYFDGLGLLAARLARCGGEAGYYDLADVILKTQHEWVQDPNPVDALYRTALRTGVPTSRLESCVTDREFAESLVADFQEIVEAGGVQSTPTFFIGDQRIEGARPFSEIAAAIEEELNR